MRRRGRYQSSANRRFVRPAGVPSASEPPAVRPGRGRTINTVLNCDGRHDDESLVDESLGDRRVLLQRGAAVLLGDGPSAMPGVITEVRSTSITVRPDEPLTGVGAGKHIFLSGTFGRLQVRVLSNHDTVVLGRPESTQMWFKTKRRHRRFAVSVGAELRFEDGRIVAARTSDLSLGGSMLLTGLNAANVTVDTPLQLGLDLAGERCSARSVIRFVGSRDEGCALGVQFRVMPPACRSALVRYLEHLATDLEQVRAG